VPWVLAAGGCRLCRRTCPDQPSKYLKLRRVGALLRQFPITPIFAETSYGWRAMKAFLSHSSRDKPLVEEVAEHLGTAQVELDSSTFDNGLLNVTAIQGALKRSSIFVLFLTRDALDSSYVRFEALLAQELQAKGIREIPCDLSRRGSFL
jgi:hypothetical protein